MFSVNVHSNSHFLKCTLRPVAEWALNILQAAQGNTDPNCSPTDDCIELDHYPAMPQGNHGTCWRMSATNILRHALSKEKQKCVPNVSPFSFSKYTDFAEFARPALCKTPEEFCNERFPAIKQDCLNMFKDNICYDDSGSSEYALNRVNEQNGRIHIAPYLFSCKDEPEFMKALAQKAEKNCDFSQPWIIITPKDNFRLNARMVSGICTVFRKHSSHYLQNNELETVLEQAEDPGIYQALEDSLRPSVSFDSQFEFLSQKFQVGAFEDLQNISPEGKYHLIRKALRETNLPVLIHTLHSGKTALDLLSLSWIPFQDKIFPGLHILTATAARTRENGDKQIFLEDSAGIFNGWHSADSLGTVTGIQYITQ
ncbi:MAG: hypothetical protein WCK42_07335 [Myxococcaceae bacterium]